MITSLLIAQLMLYWDAPTTREDGTGLPVSEIDHYELQLDGQTYDTYPNTTTEADVGTAEGVYRIRVFDIYGGDSAWSNEVVVTIKRGRPSPPGYLRRQK